MGYKWNRGIALFNRFPEKVRFLDTTLRDGEQTPGVSLTPDNKLLIARQLDELGVDVIEAGFASVSNGEMEAIKRIVREGLKAEICSCSRGVKSDIDAVIESEADSIHLVIPTSDLHLQYKLKKTREALLGIVEECVQYAKDHGLIVELSAEDATRSDVQFLKQVFATGLSSGADRICICDTVGVLTIERAYKLFSEIRSTFPNNLLSVHCHNDLGLAVANSIVALGAGADQVHATINGLGERAGNASLEEIAVALKTLYNVKTGIKTELLYSTSRLVARLTGIYPQPNKAIVGENAFAHESGIHAHGVLSHPATYEPIPPETVGAVRRVVVGKHAGSHGVKAVLEEMGLKPSQEQLEEIFRQVKELGDKGKRVTDVDLLAIAEQVMGLKSARPILLEEITVVTGNKVTPTASVRLKINGRPVIGTGIGVGPVDAAIIAVKNAISEVEPVILEQYSVKAITGGTDAVVEVFVRLRKGDLTVTSVGVREDIVMASVEAMLNGMNALVTINNKASRNKPDG
ncbi:MAG: 2-isopropylmalate synthase [Candidatus Bathyarchaeota archaeon]|nr:2-isopropylmalate synthase [Candidatus Bathyarchaeota archaeon]MCX8176729.1 2-isopropylmalate synthase [Candidatus Bathyarchaeota archaeon]MDW8193257.1 2-isopropylmalate synthase [Nitrososphaerota archaeon]